MITVPRKPAIPAKIQRLSFKEWLKGTVTAFDNGRTPVDGLVGSGNAILDQDGTIRPRPSLVRYGTQPTGTILGEIFEFVRVSGVTATNYMLTIQNVAGTSQCYYSKDGGAWTLATGKIFSNTGNPRYSQADQKVVITDAVDNLAYFDIPTLAVVPFVGLSTPGAPTPTKTGMAGTTFNHFYKVTANSTVGETAGSVEGTTTSGLIRDNWDPVTNFMTITWSAVTNAKSYNLYYSDQTGIEVLIASGINSLSYKDDGSNAKQVAIPCPIGDTTAGPICSRSTVINGQIFLTGDINNPFYVRFGGMGVSTFDFSPFNGGGWTELGRGTKQFPVKVAAFRDGKGNAAITALCMGTNGFGKRFILTPDTTTIGNTVLSFFSVTEDSSQDGTNSPDGVIVYKGSLWYPSNDGFKTTGTKPQLQNVLSTDTISETIIRDIATLSTAAMINSVGLPFQERLYWLVPVGTTTNNQIWVLDLLRQGAWMKPWNISAQWIMLYNSNDGATHFIVLGYNNVIYELTYAQATNDDGVAFPVNATSGLLKFSPDGMDWAKVIDITFTFLKPQGTINLSVAGQTQDAPIASIGSQAFVSNSSVAGWGEAGWGGSPDLAKPKVFGWSNFSVVPVIFGDAQDFVTIDIQQELSWISWELDTSASGVSFNLADVVVRYVIIGVIILS